MNVMGLNFGYHGSVTVVSNGVILSHVVTGKEIDKKMARGVTKTTIKKISKKNLNITFFAYTINKGNKKIVIDIKFKEYVPIIDNICKEFNCI